MTTATTAKPPHLFWRLTESRAIFEFGSLRLLERRLKYLPKGDGHPVLILPGFLASDLSTRPMRRVLRRLDYDVYGWHLGRNDRFNLRREQAMFRRLHHVYETSGGQPITIIGWSLGGVFAREMAKVHPDMVRQVITLGSPLSNNRGYSTASRLFERLNGKRTKPERQGRYHDLASAPPVPTTSIFTRTDGVVAWEASVQKGQYEVENIEVPASHIGLGVNPLVMVAVADRLAQRHGEWMPFRPKGWRRLFFRRHHAA